MPDSVSTGGNTDVQLMPAYDKFRDHDISDIAEHYFAMTRAQARGRDVCIVDPDYGCRRGWQGGIIVDDLKELMRCCLMAAIYSE